MATIRISEAEAARDFRALLERVRAGEEVCIDDATRTIAILHAPTPAHRTASQVLAGIRSHPTSAIPEPGFAADVEAAVRSHDDETLRDPWE